MAWKELFLLWIWNFRAQKINVWSALLVHICFNLCHSSFGICYACCLVRIITNFTNLLLLSNNWHNNILEPDSFYGPGYNPTSSFAVETKTIVKFSLRIIKKEIHFIIPIITISNRA